jgi:hypothetical protein
MKGHPHHPALHHHALGELSVSSERVRLHRQQFVDAVTARGGRYEDESTLFEHLIAKWPF